MLNTHIAKRRLILSSTLGLLCIGGVLYFLSSSHEPSLEYGFDEHGNLTYQTRRLPEAHDVELRDVTDSQDEGASVASKQMEGGRTLSSVGSSGQNSSGKFSTENNFNTTLGPTAVSAHGGDHPASSSEDAQQTELPRYKSDCLKADLESPSNELKGTLHEFQLPRKFSKNEELCVFVDGKSVQYSRIDAERVRIDWKIAKSSTKVSASYCNEGKKCKLSCPAPEKDFWDSIGDGTESGAGEGFVANESVEERELQKELKALKDVLNRKPAQAKIAVWKIAAVNEISCK